MNARSIALVLSMVTPLAACVTVGQPFREDASQLIEMNVTTKAEVRRLLGEPWRTGVEDGRETWTYGHYRYSAFAPARTRDLLLRFDTKGIVVSYSYNATQPPPR